MMTRHDANLQATIESLRGRDQLELDDALALAEVSIRALSNLSHSGAVDAGKIDDMAGRVSRLKAGISHLQANSLRHCHIPEAGSQLDAAFEATETAAVQIMEAAETILGADSRKPKAYRETVNAQIMAIFEACAFQDITGQRISRVRDKLNSIESRVAGFADAVGAQDAASPASETEAAGDRRTKELMLNGPSRAGEGISQDDIDALLED